MLIWTNTILLSVCLISKVKAAAKWDFQILSLTTESHGRDDIEMNFNLKRISRQHIVIDGYCTLKEDLNDNEQFNLQIFRSISGSEQSYVRTPFAVPTTRLSDFFNNVYRLYLIDSLQNCTTNLPEFNEEGIFQPPLTTRQMVMTNCTLDTNNFPPEMTPGFYRAINTLENANGKVIATLLLKIDRKN